MASRQRDSRALIIGLLREANIMDEIIEEVVQACEIANYSASSFASNSVTVAMLAEKLYLTREEAKSLKQVTLQRLNREEDSNKDSYSHPVDPSPSRTTTSTSKISMEVLPSCSGGFHQLRSSWLSFRSKDPSPQSTTETRTQQTDCTTDGDSSSLQTTVDETSTIVVWDPSTKAVDDDLESFVMDEKFGMHVLADVYLDRAHRPRGRPFIPPLHLQDAGISFGPPNVHQSRSSSSHSVSFPLIDDPSSLSFKESSKKDIDEAKLPCEKSIMTVDLGSNEDQSNGKPMESNRDVPSYQRPTIASEARRVATMRRLACLKRRGSKGSMMNQLFNCQLSGHAAKRSKVSFSHLGKLTRAALARMEYIKLRLSESYPLDNEFPKKKACCLKGAVDFRGNKRLSTSSNIVAL